MLIVLIAIVLLQTIALLLITRRLARVEGLIDLLPARLHQAARGRQLDECADEYSTELELARRN